MNLVITLVDGEHRNGGVDYDEPWDGRNEKGDLVANGVYFFKVETAGGQTEWGKLVVLK
jgi:flagellar hook assembly protein FlgD